MALYQPSNLPAKVSFITLLNVLRMRSAKVPAFNLERELLFEELLDKERSLEQKILIQLEQNFYCKMPWWKDLYHRVLFKVRGFRSSFSWQNINRHELNSREHQG
jgi:hypothetical protein